MIRVWAQFKSQGMATHENPFTLGVGRTWFFDIVLCMYDWACFMGGALNVFYKQRASQYRED